MNSETITGENPARLDWMDNLRTVSILLVVLYHIGGVYESAGLWASFWIVDDPDTIIWVGIIGIIFDIIVMPMMFFISGYLTPNSFANESKWTFLKKKAKRLMLPWLIAVFTLIPIYKFIFLYSRNLPRENWTTYFHFVSPNTMNWLWFLPVLYLFNVLYLIFSSLNIRIPSVSAKWVITAVFLIGLANSLVIGSVMGFRTWTHSPLMDFENERLMLYFMIFLLGIFYNHNNIFDGELGRKKMYNIVNSLAWIPLGIHIFFRLLPFFYPNEFTLSLSYRSWWWFSFNVSLVTLMYLMIETFRRYFDSNGPVWSELNRNSYGVYIIHVVAIGIFGTMLMKFSLPALLKYPLLIILTYLVCNFVVSAYRRLRAIAVG